METEQARPAGWAWAEEVAWDLVGSGAVAPAEWAVDGKDAGRTFDEAAAAVDGLSVLPKAAAQWASRA